eukprot:9466771-Pyramimonas_sp.AAC.1
MLLNVKDAKALDKHNPRRPAPTTPLAPRGPPARPRRWEPRLAENDEEGDFEAFDAQVDDEDLPEELLEERDEAEAE